MNDELREILALQLNLTLLHKLVRSKKLGYYCDPDGTEYRNFIYREADELLSRLQPYIDRKVAEERESYNSLIREILKLLDNWEDQSLPAVEVKNG